MVEWDRNKAVANRLKHGVDFSDAVAALEDDWAIAVRVDDPDEDRYIAIGMDGFGRVLVVSYTWRDDEIRLISARRANARERRRYADRRA